MGENIEPRMSPDEQCIALTKDFRLIQTLRGHRYSVDDMLVGHLACTRAGSPQRVLDLGCGLGSVMLITASVFLEATFVGLEKLAAHVALAERNIRLNGCEGRARVVAGDLRDRSLMASLGSFDLVTGSPPYFDPRSGTLCADPARAAAHFELHGGIEDYAKAASQVLRPEGVFVACAGAEPPQRDRAALEQASLTLQFHQPVVPRTSKKPFLTLLVATKDAQDEGPVIEASPLVLRDEEGRRTAQHLAIRQWTGVGCQRRK